MEDQLIKENEKVLHEKRYKVQEILEQLKQEEINFYQKLKTEKFITKEYQRTIDQVIKNCKLDHN